MIRGLKIIKTIYDLLKGIKRYLKTSMSGADIVIVTSHGLEDFTFNDVVYDNLDIDKYLTSKSIGVHRLHTITFKRIYSNIWELEWQSFAKLLKIKFIRAQIYKPLWKALIDKAINVFYCFCFHF